MTKELIVPIYLENGLAVCGLNDRRPCSVSDPAALAVSCSNDGVDALLVFDFSNSDAEHDAAVGCIREMARAVDIPIYAGGNIRRMEDVKKLIYAGCRKVFLNYAKESNVELTHEVSSKFGKEKILACVRTKEEFSEAVSHSPLLGGAVCLLDEKQIKEAISGVSNREELPPILVLLPNGNDASDTEPDGTETVCPDTREMAMRQILCMAEVSAAVSDRFLESSFDVMEYKHLLKKDGIDTNTYEASVAWEELKKNSDNMVPVVVQDYKTEEVLMVAYMNQEAFETTVRTGRMTYWSRSREALWVKGETSGHYQYVRELLIDCDNDTLLAKVHQIGAACHTGNRSCFYRSIMKRDYDSTNPMKVFEEVYRVIEDRKIHPKEGSYTNYLFDKGIDKILKKVGEEATEIIIAAKNPDPEEIKYEISDFLYHVMVLMAERNVTWEDITKELARR